MFWYLRLTNRFNCGLISKNDPQRIQILLNMHIMICHEWFMFQYCSVHVENMHMILLKDASHSSMLHLTVLQLQTYFTLKKSMLVPPFKLVLEIVCNIIWNLWFPFLGVANSLFSKITFLFHLLKKLENGPIAVGLFLWFSSSVFSCKHFLLFQHSWHPTSGIIHKSSSQKFHS